MDTLARGKGCGTSKGQSGQFDGQLFWCDHPDLIIPEFAEYTNRNFGFDELDALAALHPVGGAFVRSIL